MAGVVDTAGIIPAGAGKSFDIWPKVTKDKDHPRGCGEKVEWIGKGPNQPGSSPRVRGKDLFDRPKTVGVGIIPAGAGKSSSFAN